MRRELSFHSVTPVNRGRFVFNSAPLVTLSRASHDAAVASFSEGLAAAGRAVAAFAASVAGASLLIGTVRSYVQKACQTETFIYMWQADPFINATPDQNAALHPVIRLISSTTSAKLKTPSTRDQQDYEMVQSIAMPPVALERARCVPDHGILFLISHITYREIRSGKFALALERNFYVPKYKEKRRTNTLENGCGAQKLNRFRGLAWSGGIAFGMPN